jgi:hypothetical protein
MLEFINKTIPNQKRESFNGNREYKRILNFENDENLSNEFKKTINKLIKSVKVNNTNIPDIKDTTNTPNTPNTLNTQDTHAHIETLDNTDNNLNAKIHYLFEKKINHKLNKRATQLKFRIGEGNGKALYIIGIEDDGTANGISIEYLLNSINCLYKIANIINATITSIRIYRGNLPNKFICTVRIKLLTTNTIENTNNTNNIENTICNFDWY